MKQTKKEKVLAVAKKLCIPNNTVTNKEIKLELRKLYPYNKWGQDEISSIMKDFHKQGLFNIIQDNGTYRTYALVNNKPTSMNTNTPNGIMNSSTSRTTRTRSTKKSGGATQTTIRTRSAGTRISRSKALDLIKNSNGKFFTVTFIKKDGTRRTMNGQHTSNMGVSALGYINVKDITAVRRKESFTVKSVNLQTIETIRLGKTTYKVA